MTVQILQGDCVEVMRDMEANSVHCCVTSPPYWGLRDYGVAGQIGLETTPAEYIEKMLDVFAEVWRVLRPDGTCWINMGDSYASKPPGCQNGGVSESSTLHGIRGITGTYRETLRQSVGQKRNTISGGLKPKDLCGIPWRLAFALQADGWYLRQDIIWHKPNPMPESVTDRCTKSHEYIFLLTKAERYFYDAEAIKEPNSENSSKWGQMVPTKTADAQGKHGSSSAFTSRMSHDECIEKYYTNGRNKRSVWTITTRGYSEAHFATFPPDLPETCIRAGTSEKGVCPACGAPWRRKLVKNRQATRPGTTSKLTGDSLTDGNRDPGRHVTTVTTTGWEPACKCGAGAPVPATVLDPFGGAGTTGLVADRLGRNAILIELNPEYCELARKRIIKDAPLLSLLK